MPRPKPPEEYEPITVRLTRSQSAAARALAENSRTAKGLAMSLNQYCAAILAEAIDNKITVRERLRYDMSSEMPSLKVAEPDSDEGKQKKRA